MQTIKISKTLIVAFAAFLMMSGVFSISVLAEVEVTNEILSKDLTPTSKEKKEEKVERYATATYKNINKLMWLLGVYSIENQKDVENYIKISECNLYDKYYRDDFEWQRIQQATVEYLGKYTKDFSNFFEIVQPLKLDRYDFDLKGFTLDPPNALANISSLQMYEVQSGGKPTECVGVSIDDSRYTGNAVLKLKSPIGISYIRVDPALAKEYLRYVEDRRGTLSAKTAYIRYKVRVDRFIALDGYQNLGLAQVLAGKVLQVDVFADQELFLPLFSQRYD